MRVTVEPDRCVASGQCAMVAPNVFDQDDDGIVVLLREHAADADSAAVREAVHLCPSRAIASTESG